MKKVKVLVSKEGIQFGKCWISHERILGLTSHKAVGPIVRANYEEWLAQALKPCPHKIGTDSDGHDVCVHCGEYWEETQKK